MSVFEALFSMVRPLLTRQGHGWEYGTTIPVIGSCTVAMVAAAVFLHNTLLAPWEPKLTKGARDSGETVETVRQNAARALVGGIVTAVVGPSMLLFAAFFAQKYPDDDPMNFQFNPLVADDDATRVYFSGMAIAEAFVAYILFGTVMWAMGWDKGLDTIIHHIGFFTCCLLVVQRGEFMKLDCFAMGMELSTPFLSFYGIARQVEGAGWRQAELWSGLTFCASFLVLRPGLFCYQFARTTYVFYSSSTNLAPDVSQWRAGAILGCYTLGASIQLLWSYAVLSKLCKGVRTVMTGKDAKRAPKTVELQ